MGKRPAGYIPALSYRLLTPLYDVLLRLIMRDAEIKTRLVHQANITNGQRVLDVGCGTATLTIRIKRRYPGADVIGLDADPEILRFAERNAARAGVELTLMQASATALPFPDASFDRVVSSLVLHHLTRQAKRRVIQEIFRVLRAGGQVDIADFGKPHTPLMRALSLVTRHLERTADNFDGLLPTMLGNAGFVDVDEPAHYGRPFGTIALLHGRKPG